MEKKYVLTNETICAGPTLHRIQAVKDFGDVKAGDLGGFIEKEENLDHKGLCWVYDDAHVHDDAMVFGNGRVSGYAAISEHARVFGNAHVFGDAWVFGRAFVFGDSQIYGDAQVYGSSQIFENAHVLGEAKISWDARVAGNAKVFGSAQIWGVAVINERAFIQKANDYLVLGPIGSRSDFTTFYKTKDGSIWVSCGCFNDSIENFEKRVKEVHGISIFKDQYMTFIEASKNFFKINKE